MPRSGSIRLLIVDDSAVFRAILVKGLSADPAIEVVGVAGDPYEAAERIQKLQPDVLICDVEMPRMNGVEFVRQLMPQHPMPVIVASSVSKAIFDALHAGAVDFITKPNFGAVNDVERFLLELIRKIKIAGSSITRPRTELAAERTAAVDRPYGSDDDLIVIGASTGGTEAIHRVLQDLPPDMPGIAVVQHIPPVFSSMFAERLNATTKFRVKEAQTGDVLMRGTVLIAPGDKHMRIAGNGSPWSVRCDAGDKVNGHCPSVDVLFESAAKSAGRRVIAVLLTGMGYDGAKGMLAVRRRGGRTIGQDEATSVVYGMPRAAFEVGAVERVVPLHLAARTICSFLS